MVRIHLRIPRPREPRISHSWGKGCGVGSRWPCVKGDHPLWPDKNYPIGICSTPSLFLSRSSDIHCWASAQYCHLFNRPAGGQYKHGCTHNGRFPSVTVLSTVAFGPAKPLEKEVFPRMFANLILRKTLVSSIRNGVLSLRQE